MFEISGRLKTISIVLIFIGIVSVAYSFIAWGADHHEEGNHHASTEHHDDHHAEDTNGNADHHDSEMHHEDAEHDTHHESAVHESHAGHDDIHPLAHHPEKKITYHKTASRATPDNDHKAQDAAHHDPEHEHHQLGNRPWANLLVNNFFFLAIGLGALFFLAVQYAAQAAWTVVVLRILEAMSQFIWIPMLIMLVLIVTGLNHIGGNHIWHWMAEGIMNPDSPNYDKIIAGKEGFLNGGFFIIRTVVYFIGWVGGAYMLRKLSANFEKAGYDYGANWKKMRNWGAGFLVFFAVTSSTSAWDFIMSIDTHWFSTLFGWYVFAGMFVTALTFLMMIVIYLKSKGYLQEINQSHIHDMAKFMFAFSIFWTYLWFSQYMLIWYSNIPEEVTYYMARWGDYKGLFLGMLVMNFIFPILVLMSRDSKRNFGFIITAGIIMIVGHWLDVYIMIHPGTVGANWSITLIHFGTFLGYLGLFILVTFRALSKLPLMPKNHPMYLESKQHHI